MGKSDLGPGGMIPIGCIGGYGALTVWPDGLIPGNVRMEFDELMKDQIARVGFVTLPREVWSGIAEVGRGEV